MPAGRPADRVCEDARQAPAYSREHFEDPPEIRDWVWTEHMRPSKRQSTPLDREPMGGPHAFPLRFQAPRRRGGSWRPSTPSNSLRPTCAGQPCPSTTGSASSRRGACSRRLPGIQPCRPPSYGRGRRDGRPQPVAEHALSGLFAQGSAARPLSNDALARGIMPMTPDFKVGDHVMELGSSRVRGTIQEKITSEIRSRGTRFTPRKRSRST